MVVAIDGPAGVGKSTIARKVAEAAGFFLLNSGSFYRALTWGVLRAGVNPHDEESVVRIARASVLDVADGVTLNGRNVEKVIHSDDVDRWVAPHSCIPAVRDIVNRELRRIARGRDIVMEGRDIGTVVFPKAEVKVFLDADVRTRAERRYRQGTSGLSLEEIEASIRERDRVSRDAGRLEPARDAISIDSSHLTITQVCEKVMEAILLKKNNLGDARRV
jgi:cytidylate kinase